MSIGSIWMQENIYVQNRFLQFFYKFLLFHCFIKNILKVGLFSG